MYAQLFEKLILFEIVGIRLSQSEQKMKDYYEAKPRRTEVDSFGHDGEIRFWLLSDGTLIRVWESSHAETADKAGCDYYPLIKGGAIRGYIIKKLNEFGIEGHVDISSDQKKAILRLASKFQPRKVYLDYPGKGWQGTLKELEYFLEYGEDPNESIDEASAFGVIEAGWIHLNGKFEVIPDYVMGDHDKDAYQKLNPGEVFTVIAGSGRAYREYLKQGHIRYLQTSRGFNIELTGKPTQSQIRAIRKGIKEGTGEFFFSIAPSRLDAYGTHGSSWEEFREKLTKL